MIGKVIGSYKITELIGSGGMGAVYRSVDRMLDREAAVKVLHPDLAHQEQVVERFRSEAKVLAKLSHPNIATVYSLFEQENNLFMVLEFVPGRTIEELLRERGALDLETTADLMGGILAGVEHAHKLDIVHRDLKPANLILNEGGYVKVMDFGIARIVGSDRMTRSGHIVGTLEYMSPEQVQQGEADARSDIYALGVVLYEMLTGRIPFQAESDFELMKAQLESEPAAPRTISPDLPEAVEAVVLRALAKDPAERFQTADEMREALAGALEAGGRAAASKKTRLAAPGPAATRLARAEVPASSPGDEPVRSVSIAELLRPGVDKAVATARKLSWQYWVIGAAAVILLGGGLFWLGGGAGPAEGPRVADEAPADPRRSAPPDSAPPASSPPPPSGPGFDPAPPSGPGLMPPGPSPTTPAPGQPAPEPVPSNEGLDSLQRSPFERFAQSYGEIEGIVEQVRISGKSFEDEYRAYLKSAGKWKPAGGHRTAWDQLDDFNKRVTQMKRDLKEVGDEYGLLDEGRAKRLLRRAREGARDVAQRITGDEADASLGRLRTQAREIESRADQLGAQLRNAGVSGSLDSSWTRVRTLTRRVRQLFA